MSTRDKKITHLLRRAVNSTDPEELRRIATELEEYSAWDDAERVRAKAARLIRERIEKVMK